MRYRIMIFLACMVMVSGCTKKEEDCRTYEPANSRFNIRPDTIGQNSYTTLIVVFTASSCCGATPVFTETHVTSHAIKLKAYARYECGTYADKQSLEHKPIDYIFNPTDTGYYYFIFEQADGGYQSDSIYVK